MNEAKKDGKEGILNLVFNIIIPTIILVKFDSIFNIGPEWGFFIALCFPLLYGCWDLIVSGKYNFFSIIGFLSIILTGGIGLFKLDAHWIAIKEAVVPFTIGIVVLISAKTKFSIIK